MSELLECARAHTHLIMIQFFIAAIQRTTDDHVRAVLSKICSLFVLHYMESYTTTRMLEYPGYLKCLFFFDVCRLEILQVEHTRTIRMLVLELCKKLRPEVIGLVDAFNHPDCVVVSPFGR